MLQYRLPLLAVNDVEVSKKFYKEIFGQTVTMDFGANVTFSGGFAIQQGFAWLTDIDEKSIVKKSHNMELYFEVDDFDEFLEELNRHPEVERVAPPKKHDWQQRVVRIYDPDFHMIEIGESMAVIAKRYLKEGYTVEETSAIIQHPIEFVQACKDGLI